MVNPANPVTNLTTTQIQDIYTQDIRSWSTFGGLSENINPLVRGKGTATLQYFKQLVMHGLEFPEYPIVNLGWNMRSPYREIQRDANSIGFSSYYYFKYMVDNDNTKAVSVNGIPLCHETVTDGTYPYITKVYTAIRTDTPHDSPAYKVYELMTSEKGQQIIAESGYVPLGKTTGVTSTARDTECQLRLPGNVLHIETAVAPCHIRITSTDGRMVLDESPDAFRYGLPLLPGGCYIVTVMFKDGMAKTMKWLQWLLQGYEKAAPQLMEAEVPLG